MTHPNSQDDLGSQTENAPVYWGAYIDEMFYALDKAMTREVVSRDITGLEYRLLCYCLDGSRTATQLAQVLPVDASRISLVVTRLVDRGFLGRRRLRSDRRVVMLELTEERGWSLLRGSSKTCSATTPQLRKASVRRRCVSSSPSPPG